MRSVDRIRWCIAKEFGERKRFAYQITATLRFPAGTKCTVETFDVVGWVVNHKVLLLGKNVVAFPGICEENTLLLIIRGQAFKELLSHQFTTVAKGDTDNAATLGLHSQLDPDCIAFIAYQTP